MAATLLRAASRYPTVDDLHQRAGSTDVQALHGELMHEHCLAECGWHAQVRIHDQANDYSIGQIGGQRRERSQRSPNCGDWLRPSVVWFGDMLPPTVFDNACELVRHCDLMLVVGTSGVVYPAAQLSMMAAEQGAPVVIVNPETGPLDGLADHCLYQDAAGAMSALVD